MITVQRLPNQRDKFLVTQKNWFRTKTTVWKLLDGHTYTFGGGQVFIDKNGNKDGNTTAIGKALRKFLLAEKF